jgi:type VI secretion system protein VasD
VSLYELAAPNSFLDADFYRLSGGAAAALGKDLVAQDQFMMMPGATRSVVRELDPQTRFLGMTAAYRVIDQADWRALVPIPLNRMTPVQGRLDPLAVTLTPAGGGS